MKKDNDFIESNKEPESPKKNKNNKPLIVSLIILIVLLVSGIVILAVKYISNPGGSSSSSSTPTSSYSYLPKETGKTIYDNFVTTLSNVTPMFGGTHEVQSVGSVSHTIDGDSGKTYIWSSAILKDKSTSDIVVGTFAIQLNEIDMETFCKGLSLGPITLPEAVLSITEVKVKVTDYDCTQQDKFIEQYPVGWNRYINFGDSATNNEVVGFSGMFKQTTTNNILSLTRARFDTTKNDFYVIDESKDIGKYDIITPDKEYFYSLVDYIVTEYPL